MAAPISISVTTDKEEYSRFESERDVVSVFVTPEGSNMSGEAISVQMVKARRNRDVVVATKQLVLTSNDPQEYVVDFPLNDIVDNYDIPRVRRGKYLILATADNAVTGESEDFLISLVSVDRLMKDYLHGVEGRAFETLAPRNQPELITGVIIEDVSKTHPNAWFPLSYNYILDTNGTPVRTLSWCAGPAVLLTASKKRYLLRKGNTVDFIEVRITSLSQLPTQSISEEILIERAPLDDSRIRQLIDQAISWVEDSEIDVYLEPTHAVTQINPVSITYPTGSDIPTFELGDWDIVVDAVTYRAPTAGHWVSIKMPYRPVLRFNQLFGEIANTKIIDISLEWIELHELGGFVELVPFNQSNAFNFMGMSWVDSLRGPVPLPNFWNFDVILGFRKTPEVLLELVAKKAAIDFLTIAGQAYRAGISSQSISRDGISESISYTASATFGIFSATIADYKKWIDENIKHLRSAFRGSAMVVL